MGPVFTSSSVNIFTAALRSAHCVGITAFCFAYDRRLPTVPSLTCNKQVACAVGNVKQDCPELGQ